jgi:hypothetical protein
MSEAVERHVDAAPKKKAYCLHLSGGEICNPFTILASSGGRT